MSLLTICLPVRNGQAMLESLAEEAFEILHDLVPRWELLILDNGSTDATSEVAHELVTRYPQVRQLGFPLPVSRALLWRAALTETRGDLLLFRDADCRLDMHDLLKLWQALPGRDAVLAQAKIDQASGWVGIIQRLGQAAATRTATESAGLVDLALLRRRAFDAARTAQAPGASLGGELRRYGHPWVELTLKTRGLGQVPPPPQSTPAARAAQQINASAQGDARVRRPNYLAGLKNFARGE